MSNQPAEDAPQGWSMVFANPDTMEMETTTTVSSSEGLAWGMLPDLLELAWQQEMRAAMRHAEAWKRKNTAEVGRKMAKTFAGLNK